MVDSTGNDEDIPNLNPHPTVQVIEQNDDETLQDQVFR